MYNNPNDFNQWNNYPQGLNSNGNNQLPKKRKTPLNIIIIIIVIAIIVGLVYYFLPKLMHSYKVVFSLNGADEIEMMELTCQASFSGDCKVTLPVSKRINGEVIGYSKNANNKEAEYKIGEELVLTEDMNLYVISKKVNQLVIDTSSIDDIRKSNTSCEVYNLDKACEVTVPMFNKLGYEIHGYTKDKGNQNNLIAFESKISIDDNLNLYPVYTEYPYYEKSGKTHFNIEKSEFMNNMYIDVGKSCNISSSLIPNLQKLFTTYPFYSYNSKITLLSSSDYTAFERASSFSNSAGFTNEYEYANPTVLIKCTNEMSPYAVAVHELSHVLDVRYKTVSGHFINEEQELIELRNKYKNASKSTIM